MCFPTDCSILGHSNIVWQVSWAAQKDDALFVLAANLGWQQHGLMARDLTAQWHAQRACTPADHPMCWTT